MQEFTVAASDFNNALASKSVAVDKAIGRRIGITTKVRRECQCILEVSVVFYP
jgi:hypothetical protein